MQAFDVLVREGTRVNAWPETDLSRSEVVVDRVEPQSAPARSNSWFFAKKAQPTRVQCLGARECYVPSNASPG